MVTSIHLNIPDQSSRRCIGKAMQVIVAVVEYDGQETSTASTRGVAH